MPDVLLTGACLLLLCTFVCPCAVLAEAFLPPGSNNLAHSPGLAHSGKASVPVVGVQNTARTAPENTETSSNDCAAASHHISPSTSTVDQGISIIRGSDDARWAALQTMVEATHTLSELAHDLTAVAADSAAVATTAAAALKPHTHVMQMADVFALGSPQGHSYLIPASGIVTPGDAPQSARMATAAAAADAVASMNLLAATAVRALEARQQRVKAAVAAAAHEVLEPALEAIGHTLFDNGLLHGQQQQALGNAELGRHQEVAAEQPLLTDGGQGTHGRR